MKRHVIIHVDLSWEQPSDRAEPEVVREPAGALAGPVPATPPDEEEPADDGP
ncbi:hypothetical protein [Actinomadura rubrisoli]|uniref:hypothetical protein n=1 Tax=Actinomadura rubrisoli TaxID=2530368 RepID=UPI001405584E|nr:hypothetical protein [Actinomadura rubrisoli]